MLDEQRHYDHPQLSEEQIEHDIATAPGPRFTGENIILVARAAGKVVGLCWCVLFNPGTGLEAEVAEVYVDAASGPRGSAGTSCATPCNCFVSETSPLPLSGLAKTIRRPCASTRRQDSDGRAVGPYVASAARSLKLSSVELS